MILYLLDEEPSEAVAHGRDFLTPGVEDVVFCYLRFPSGKIAHMHLSWLDPHKMRRITVVGRDKMAVFDDMELERKVTVYDKAPWKRAETYGEWQTRTRRHLQPEDRDRRAAAARVRALPAPRRGEGGTGREVRATALDGRARARAADRTSLRGGGRCAEIHPTAIVYPGHRARRGREGARVRGRRQAAVALAALDREARAAAAGRDRRRDDRLHRRGRLRRHDGSARA